MTWWQRLSLHLRALVRKGRVEQELDEELRFHLEKQIEENIATGMNPEEARYAARRTFGGVEQIKEECRDMRGIAFIENLFQDLRYGVRMLRKSPAFTAVAVLSLALSIGANTAIFSVVNGVLLRPLPYPDPERLVMVYASFFPQNMKRGWLSIADFLDWQAQNHVFEDVAAFSRNTYNITGLEEPEQVPGVMVTAGFFSTLRAQPMVGRVFQPGEDQPGRPLLAVLSEGLWQRRFGGSPQAIGREIRLNGRAHTIVGVMPARFESPQKEAELWSILPLSPTGHRGPFFLRGIARLKPGVTLEQVQREMNALARQVEQAHPKTYSHLSFPVVALHEALVGDARPALFAMFGAVVFVLLIASVNVASLLLGRAAAREREMAIRLSLGASRRRPVEPGASHSQRGGFDRPRSGGFQDQHHGASDFRIRRGAAVSYRADGHVRGRSAASGGHRHLRGHCLFGYATAS